MSKTKKSIKELKEELNLENKVEEKTTEEVKQDLDIADIPDLQDLEIPQDAPMAIPQGSINKMTGTKPSFSSPKKVVNDPVILAKKEEEKNKKEAEKLAKKEQDDLIKSIKYLPEDQFSVKVKEKYPEMSDDEIKKLFDKSKPKGTGLRNRANGVVVGDTGTIIGEGRSPYTGTLGYICFFPNKGFYVMFKQNLDVEFTPEETQIITAQNMGTILKGKQAKVISTFNVGSLQTLWDSTGNRRSNFSEKMLQRMGDTESLIKTYIEGQKSA